jgi:hypothetical protein
MTDASDEFEQSSEEKADAPAPFNLMAWSGSIPLCEDLWLGMQVRNIAMVDVSIVRQVEQQALDEYMATEKTPIMVLSVLSALSQMWVFSVYEFLRTWRERAKHILKLADEYQTVKESKKEAFLAKAIENAQSKSKHIKIAPSYQIGQVGRIADKAFIQAVKKFYEDTDGLFKQIEGLRVTLAKHEVPKGRGFFAEAPGYARMNTCTGSIYWHFDDKDGYTHKVDRREIANAFMGVTDKQISLKEEPD